MASDIHVLDDSEDDYYEFVEDDSLVSQSQFHNGIFQPANVGGGDPHYDVETFLENLRHMFYSSKAPGPSNGIASHAEIPPKRATSRCNHGYFSELLRKTPPQRKDFVRINGFAFLLDFECTSVPRGFAQWVAGHVNTPTGDIVLSDGVIPMSAESFHLLFGLPLGGRKVLFDSESTKAAFLNIIGEPALPSIKWFGTRMLKPDISNEDFLRCFLLVAFATVLCPNSNIYPSTKYLGLLIEPSEARQFDLSKFVFDWLMAYIRKFQKEPKNKGKEDGFTTLGGCIYGLGCYYLDFLDFGLRRVPPGLPRVKAWKNSLVKEFANLDCKGPREYGLRPVKKISDTVYSMGCVGCCEEHLDSSHESMKFRSSIDKTVGGLLPTLVKEQISLIARRFRASTDEKYVEAAQNMLLDCLNCIVLATVSNRVDEDSKTNSTQDPTNNLADSENSILEPNGPRFDPNGGDIQMSPIMSHANPDLNDTAGSGSSKKRKNFCLDNEDHIPVSNPKSTKSLRVDDRDDVFYEQGRKLDFNGCDQINSVYEVIRKLIPPKHLPVSDSVNKSISFNHLVHSSNVVPTSLAAKSSQCTLDKMMPVKKKPIFHDKLRLKTSINVEDDVIPSQNSIQEENINSSQIQFRWREEVSQYKQTPIHMDTLPFTPIPTPSTSALPQKAATTVRSFDGKEYHAEPSRPPKPPTKVNLISIPSRSPQLSPEVEIIGEVKFSGKCDDLLNSEDIYNQKSNIPGSSTSGRVVRYGPRRIINPSKFNDSPYVNTRVSRYQVTNKMIQLHDAIINLSRDEDTKYKTCIDYGKVTVTFFSFGTSFANNGLVDTYTINAWCRKLSLDTKPKESRVHHFFHLISEHFLNMDSYETMELYEQKTRMVQRCFQLARGARSIHTCDEVHFPTLCEKHWFDFVVLFQHKTFVILDSAYDIDSSFHKHVLSILIPNFKRVWNMFGSKQITDWADWGLHFPKVPKQSNEYDCGVHTSMYLKHWKPRVKMQDFVSDEDILNLRIKLANEMMFCEHNSLTDAKNRVLEF